MLSAYIAAEFTGTKGADRVAHHVSRIVIANRTESDWNDGDIEADKPVSWKKVSRYLHKEARGLQMSTLDSFRDANTHPALFSHSFHLPVTYELLDKAEFDAIFQKGGWWKDYYRKYPDSQGFLRLSRVGFGAGGKQAVFYVKNQCGGKCGTGSYVVMENIDSGWKVTKEILIWIS